MVAAEAPPSRRRLVIALAGALAMGTVAVATIALRKQPTAFHSLRGVTLGLSASDTRARFRPDSEGSWSLDGRAEPTLRWARTSPSGPVTRAAFEFHQGMLVAIRLDLSPDAPEASGPPLELSPQAVLSRRPTGDVTRLVILSRSCPAHTGEVASVLAGQAASAP